MLKETDSDKLAAVHQIFVKVGLRKYTVYLDKCDSDSNVVVLCIDLCAAGLVDSKVFRSLIKQVFSLLKPSSEFLVKLLDRFLEKDSYKPGFVVVPVILNRVGNAVLTLDRIKKMVHWINEGAKHGAHIRHLCDKPCEATLKAILGMDNSRELLNETLEFANLLGNLENWRSGWRDLKDKRKPMYNDVFDRFYAETANVQDDISSLNDENQFEKVAKDEDEELVIQLKTWMVDAEKCKAGSVLTMADIMETLSYEEKRPGNHEMPRDKINKFYKSVRDHVYKLAEDESMSSLLVVMNIVLNTHSKKLIDLGNTALIRLAVSLKDDATKEMVKSKVFDILNSESCLRLRPYALSTVLTTLSRYGFLDPQCVIEHFLSQASLPSKSVIWFNDSTLSRLFEVRMIPLNYLSLLKMFYSRKAYSYVRSFYQLSSAVFCNGSVSLSYFYYADQGLLEIIFEVLDELCDMKMNYTSLEMLQSCLLVLEVVDPFEFPESLASRYTEKHRKLLNEKLTCLFQIVPDFSFKIRLQKMLKTFSCSC
ncbi:unnamed protein product [Bursaphelenchus xylophilus]|uniref:(pine wood nematode) hypothetical protein n=1 Tax=Bursaphelenchus xylophilus TaxID=6326 RepID=A0A1I7SUD8_BURXY|nr:unnamed protein product [Bursaphelenchus xylophilus]CAG9107250.1 unnamed protein product [Bursaphelenchus xylophilus]